MAVSQALLAQLMQLGDDERLEVAQLLLATFDEDDLDELSRDRLHAALDRSIQDRNLGRVHDARALVAELRARSRP